MSADRASPVLERVLLLRTFAPFVDLAPTHLAAMAEIAEDRFFPAGAEIQPEGVPVRDVHYVISGEVEIRRAGRPVRTFGERSVVGGLAALAQVEDSAQVVAKTDVSTFSFSQEDQRDVFEDDFEVLVRIMRSVARGFLEARRASGIGGGFQPDDETAPMPRAPLGLVDKIAFLRRTGPYQQARMEAVAELAQESPEVRFSAGEKLWKAGDPSGSSLVMVAGVVTGTAEDGQQKFRFSTGSIVGGLDSLAAMPRWFDATAATDVAAIQVNYGVLLDLLEDHTEMAMDLLRALASNVLRLREAIGGESVA
ncbi:MAG TPA: cyclic nucleotide-binding domain-containing protein [Kofleriaceae bacterium]